MTHSDTPTIPSSELTWESLSTEMTAAIVNEEGDVYVPILKHDRMPPLPRDLEKHGQAVSDYFLLRLIAAMTADSSSAKVIARSGADPFEPASGDDGDVSDSPYAPADRLREAIQRIHTEASIAWHGTMLQLRADSIPADSAPVEGMPGFRSVELGPLEAVKERKERVPPLLEPLLQMMPGLSAEDLQFSPDGGLVRVPLRGFSALVPDDISPGEQLDRVDIVVKTIERLFGEVDRAVKVGGRPDPFAGWVEISIRTTRPSTEQAGRQ